LTQSYEGRANVSLLQPQVVKFLVQPTNPVAEAFSKSTIPDEKEEVEEP